MDTDTRLVLQVYRKICMKRLQDPKYRKRPTAAQASLILRMVDDCMNWGIVEQIERDLRIYKLYDALAMWADPQGGLAHYDPDTILKILRVFIKYKDLMKTSCVESGVFRDTLEALNRVKEY